MTTALKETFRQSPPGRMPMPVCAVDGCEALATSRSHGMCSNHRKLALSRPREIEGCSQPQTGRGMCNRHYIRWLRDRHETGDGSRYGATRFSPVDFFYRIDNLPLFEQIIRRDTCIETLDRRGIEWTEDIAEGRITWTEKAT